MWRCVVIALTCAACTNPDDILAVQGTVTSMDPVEGQTVRLLRSDTRAGTPFAPLCAGEPFREMQANADGEYGFEVFRLETRASCFRVDATFPSGSIAWSDFSFFSAKRTMAPLPDWRASPWIDGGVLQFEPPVPWPDDLPPVRMGNVTFLGIQLTHREQLATADGGIIWQADDRSLVADTFDEYTREPLLMDELQLEDFEGTLTLSATFLDADQPSTIDSSGATPTRMRAGQQLALRGNRVPLSRGLACPELATPCPLTDGELSEVDAGLISSVAFNLTTPARVSAVVLRGAWPGNRLIRVVLAPEDGGIATEVERTVPRADSYYGFSSGQTLYAFVDGGDVSFRPAYVVIPIDAGTPSSRVTLQFPFGLARIQEVSVFE